LLKRLWPKFDLDPDFEKLLVSSWFQFSNIQGRPLASI
jgi:hypothetical protein